MNENHPMTVSDVIEHIQAALGEAPEESALARIEAFERTEALFGELRPRLWLLTEEHAATLASPHLAEAHHQVSNAGDRAYRSDWSGMQNAARGAIAALEKAITAYPALQDHPLPMPLQDKADPCDARIEEGRPHLRKVVEENRSDARPLTEQQLHLALLCNTAEQAMERWNKADMTGAHSALRRVIDLAQALSRGAREHMDVANERAQGLERTRL